MITLNLGFHRKARIWIGGVPNVYNDVDEIIQLTLSSTSSKITEVKRVAVELTIPAGPRIIFGSLGAIFKPISSQQLTIEIAVSNNISKKVDWLSDSLNKTYFGLPVEYAKGVKEGALIAKELLGSGILYFDYALHSPIGSSTKLFHHLAVSIVQISACDILSEEKLTEIMQNCINNILE